MRIRSREVRTRLWRRVCVAARIRVDRRHLDALYDEGALRLFRVLFSDAQAFQFKTVSSCSEDHTKGETWCTPWNTQFSC